MIFKRQMFSEESNDVSLVTASLSGNRDAFTQIVSRYQSLICSLAYSATGSLTQSEDLAQETFVTAWREMKQLREPEKLRSWLCGIARNIISNSWRRNKREPAQNAEPIEAFSDFHGKEKPTPDHVIQREEEAILWRSLEQIPETYREPLILFYRQGESIERVAQQLELSEDAVKQRLSRGRKLLAEEVTAFVEGTLKLSTPGRAFTLSVLASLPVFATSASAATIGSTAMKGSAVAKSFSLLAIFTSLIGPVIGLLGAYIGVRASINATRTPRERKYVVGIAKVVIAATVAFNLVLFAYIGAAVKWGKHHTTLVVVTGIGILLTYTAWLIITVVRYNRKLRTLRTEEKRLHPELFENEINSSTGKVTEYRSRKILFGLPLIHARTGARAGEKIQPAVGWIAIGDRAYGILFAAGGVAVGGIAMGGFSIGLISLGGASLGLFAAGGFALGGFVFGGAAIGIVAAGGLAIAWLGAQGGLAIAHQFAIGGEAFARHANDSAAKEFFTRFSWLDVRDSSTRNWLTFICWSPFLLVVWQGMLQRRKLNEKNRKQSRQ
jgi:RNA polymerase sigma factor (sigma-70 family)